MLHSRWARRCAVVFAGLLVALVGVATPASADGPEVEVQFTPHCANNILKFTNNTGAAIQVRARVNGTPDSTWTDVPVGQSRTVGVNGNPGDIIEAQHREGPSGTIATFETTYTYAVPDRCDDFAVTFTDSCEGTTTVSVTNNHGAEVYLRIYAPLGVPVYDDGDDDGGDPDDWFQPGENYTGSFPMSAGDEMSVEITFGTGGVIDTVARHTYSQRGDCGSEPEFPATIEDTCTGIKVTVTNDSQEPLPVQVRRADAAPGDEPLLEFVVPAGATVTEEVAVADGVEIVLTGYNQLDLGRHKVDLKDCPDLPKTGTDVMTIVLAGLGVLVVGAGVLFGLRLARRRRLSEQ